MTPSHPLNTPNLGTIPTPDPPLADLPDDPVAIRVGVLMQELLGLLHRRFAGDALAILNETGLTMPQMVGLFRLAYGGPCSIGALAEELRLSVSATSHLVDRLVEKAFVDRREDPDDRRQKRVEITPAGQALVDRLASERTGEFARAVAILDGELRDQLVAVLERAVAALQPPRSPS